MLSPQHLSSKMYTVCVSTVVRFLDKQIHYCHTEKLLLSSVPSAAVIKYIGCYLVAGFVLLSKW